MSTFAEILAKPLTGPDFAKKLHLPSGALNADPVYTEEDTLDVGLQPGCFRTDVKNPVLDGMLGTTALSKWVESQDTLLKALFGPAEEFAPLPAPAEVYYRYWKYPVSGVLMVAHVRRTKFDVSEPFLLAVTFPGVLPRGYSGDVFTEPSKRARLQPGQGLVPDGGKFPFIGSVATDLRKKSVKDATMHPAELLTYRTLVGFGVKAFSHVVVSTADINITADDTEEFTNYIRAWDELCKQPTGSLASDLTLEVDGSSPEDADGTRLPIMLPLAGPLSLPAGIVGHTSLGLEGIRSILLDGLEAGPDSCRWLDHPVVKLWLAAAAHFPTEMAVDVTNRRAIAASLRPARPTPNPEDACFRNCILADYWKAMEGTLVFRLYLDTFMGAAKPPRSAGAFHKYLTIARNGLYHPNNLLGDRPVDVAYEVLVLRPPTTAKKWHVPYNLAVWNTDASYIPSFLRDFKSLPVDPQTFTTAPLERVDGQKTPPIADKPTFPPPVAYVDPFPDDDPRICDPNHDSQFDARERLVMTRLQTAEASDDLFPDDEDHNSPVFLLKILNHLRTLSMVKRERGTDLLPAWTGFRTRTGRPSPTPEDQEPETDMMQFLLESAAKRQRLAPPPAIDLPSSTLGDDSSGFRPRRATTAALGASDPAASPSSPARDDTAQSKPIPARLSEALFEDEENSSDTPSDDVVVLDKDPLDHLAAMFESPPGESERTAITVDTSHYESTIAILRRRFPLYNKNGEPLEHTTRALFPAGKATAESIASDPATLKSPEKWGLHVRGSRHPDSFIFWSLFLLHREPSFEGTYQGGSRKGRTVEPEGRLFPAHLSGTVRQSFLHTDPKHLEEWVQSCASAARRAATCTATSRGGWLQPGPFFHRITKEVLLHLRSGLWSCSSYFETHTPPTTSNFTVFSLLPSRSATANNLLPADGLTRSECLDVLRNAFFLLALPATQGLHSTGVDTTDAIVHATPVLAALGRLLDSLTTERRSIHSVSVGHYWEHSCNAQKRNKLAFFILSSIDELLSLMVMYIQLGTENGGPTLRFVHDRHDNDNIYLTVDPTILDPSLAQSHFVAGDSGPKLITMAIRNWETAITQKLEHACRDDLSNLVPAPEPYVDSAKRPVTFATGSAAEKGGKYQSNSTPASSSRNTSPARNAAAQAQRQRATLPIIMWGPKAPSNTATALSEILKNNGLQPRYPADGQSRSNSPLICFAFCLAGHDGCKRKGRCHFAHIDGFNAVHIGPQAFGSLTRYLSQPNVVDVLVYTDTGRRLAEQH